MRADVEVQQLDLVQRKIAARVEQPASYVVALCILGNDTQRGRREVVALRRHSLGASGHTSQRGWWQ